MPHESSSFCLQLNALSYKAALDLGLNDDLLKHFGINPKYFWGDHVDEEVDQLAVQNLDDHIYEDVQQPSVFYKYGCPLAEGNESGGWLGSSLLSKVGSVAASVASAGGASDLLRKAQSQALSSAKRAAKVTPT
jgi:hypothetical protein